MSCLPEEAFKDPVQLEFFIKGFIQCANLFQMLGWQGNEEFFKRVKRDLATGKPKKPVKKKKTGNLKHNERPYIFNPPPISFII